MGSDLEVRILLVDDHTLLREALRTVLAAVDDFQVVGDVGDGRIAIGLAARLRPTVVLLDVEIPDNQVTATVRGLLRASPQSRVIVLSMYDDPRLVQRVLALGASSFLHKSIGRHDLVTAIRACATGDQLVTVSVPRDAYGSPPERPAGPPLSEREAEVMALVAKARTNRQIAAELGITEGTVKRHLRNVFQKLNAVSRIDAVNRATVAAGRTVGRAR
jgi:two-component system nitrate/nitrite response regulator NarL